jgi:predicted ATPase
LGNTITTLQLSNLKLESVQSLIAEALRMEDDEGAVESLSNIVHKKTDGNPFFVWMFLTSRE